MRELTFEEVRAAGLPARVEAAYVTYEYRPLADDVAVRIGSRASGPAVHHLSHAPDGLVPQGGLFLPLLPSDSAGPAMNDASAPPVEKARPARGRAESPCGKRPVATAAPVAAQRRKREADPA